MTKDQLWQPIASAPKDRRILACHEGIQRSHCIVVWNDSEKCFAELDGLLRQPTHWQELPETPDALCGRTDVGDTHG